MSDQKKGKVRICRKGGEYGFIYEVPSDLTEEEKIAYAKKQHKDRARKRPYNFEYTVQS